MNRHNNPPISPPDRPTVDEEPSTPANVRSSARTTRKTIVATAVESVTTVTSQSSSSTTTTRSSTNGHNTSGGDHAATITDMSAKDAALNANELNSMFEESSAQMRLRTSTPIQSSSAALSASTTSTTAASTTTTRGRQMERRPLPVQISADGNDHVPYREYRKAGEYWK